MPRHLTLATALLVLAACGEVTNLPVEVDSATDGAAEVCASATSAEECRDLSTDTFDCGAVVSAECETDPYDGAEWRFDDCVPTNVTCTQFTIWLATEEGCRAFDGCYAPTDLYEECDPAVECPT